MTQFTRTIRIACENLGGSSPPTLVLTFDDQPMQGIYQDYFPVVWKTATFETEGSYAMTATYNSQLMFVNPQLNSRDMVISAATWVKIDLGQETNLIEQAGSMTKTFTTPVDGVGDQYIKAINKTETPQSIGVGFDNDGTPPPTMLVFHNIGSAQSVTAEFTPVLSAYITAEYQETSILRGAIQTPVIWKQDLAALAETSNWKLTYNPATGVYSINAA